MTIQQNYIAFVYVHYVKGCTSRRYTRAGEGIWLMEGESDKANGVERERERGWEKRGGTTRERNGERQRYRERERERERAGNGMIIIK